MKKDNRVLPPPKIKVETKITEILFYKAYQDQKSRQNLKKKQTSFNICDKRIQSLLLAMSFSFLPPTSILT